MHSEYDHMNEKQSILQLLMPKAVLKAMTPEARDSIPHSLLEQDMVRIVVRATVIRESRKVFRIFRFMTGYS